MYDILNRSRAGLFLINIIYATRMTRCHSSAKRAQVVIQKQCIKNRTPFDSLIVQWGKTYLCEIRPSKREPGQTFSNEANASEVVIQL